MGLSPILITGAWRSGTTLLSRIINSHPDVFITFDTVHFLRFSYGKYDPICEYKNVYCLVSDIASRLKGRYAIELNLDEVMKKMVEPYCYSSIYDAVMSHLFLNEGTKKIWGEKTNLAWRNIPQFYEMYPQGRVIHIVRDPRAVLASWKKYTRAPGYDYLDSIVNCYDSMDKALKYKNEYSEKAYVLITYEDLVMNPFEAIKDMCDVIGLQFTERMLDTSLFTDNFGMAWKPNSIYDKQLSGISTSVIGKWKTELENWEKYLVSETMGTMLSAYGYEASTDKVDDFKLCEMINSIMSSDLACNGLLNYLLTGEGIQRYPTDPTKPENW